MRRLAVAALASLLSFSVLAEGPGTRIRSGVDVSRLLDEMKKRPRKEDKKNTEDEKKTPADDRATGPGSHGDGSGATSSSTGTSGGGSFGAGAPR